MPDRTDSLRASPEATDRTTGDARLQAAFGSRLWLRIGMISGCVTVFLVAMWYMVIGTMLQDNGVPALGVDFIVYWSAAKLALAGNALEAFNLESLLAIHQVEGATWLPWLYPPGYLILLMPLGALSFMAAYLVFNTVSSIAFLAATRPFAGRATGIWIGIALAPTTLAAYMLGQTPLLWASGLLAALAALRNRREVLAGIFIGLLTLKPQLGILIPVALVAAGSWRAILSATATTLALVLIGTLAFGAAYWTEMFAIGGEHFERMRADIASRDQMISLYSGLAYLGLPEPVAFAGQMLATLIAALGTFLAWRSQTLSFDLKAAMLFSAVLLSSPYMWHYEAALLAPTLLFLLRAGVLRVTVPGLLVAGVLWLGVGPVMVMRILLLGQELPVRLFTTPIIVLAFAVTLTAVIKHLIAPGSQKRYQ